MKFWTTCWVASLISWKDHCSGLTLHHSHHSQMTSINGKCQRKSHFIQHSKVSILKAECLLIDGAPVEDTDVDCSLLWSLAPMFDHWPLVTTSDDECQVWSASVEWSKCWCPAVQSLSVITSLSSSTSANTHQPHHLIVKLHNNIQLPRMLVFLCRLLHKIIQRRDSTRSLFVDFFPTVW